MYWLFFIILGGFLLAVQSILARKLMHKKTEVWTTVFILGIIADIISLPFIFFNLESWLIVKTFLPFIFLASVISIFQYYCNYASYRYLSPSVATTVSKIQYIFIILGGVFFFSEKFGMFQIIGSILIVSSSLLIIDYTNLRIVKQGLFWRIGSSLLFASYALITKLIVTGLKPLILFGFGLIGTIVTLPLIPLLTPNFKERLKKTVNDSESMIYLIAIGILISSAGILILYGLEQTSVSITYLLIEAAVILVVIGEHLFLSADRKHLFKKIIAAILALVGVWLIKSF